MNLRRPLLLAILFGASCRGAKLPSGPGADGAVDGAVVNHGAADVPPDSVAVEAPPSDAEADALPDRGVAGDVGPDAALETHPNLDARDARDAVDAGCVPVVDGTWFVNPVAGSDVYTATGAWGCPVRTISKALTLLGAARGATDAGASPPAATIAIVNETANVALAADAEHFPLTVPANVTITASDVARPAPTLAVPAIVQGAFLFGGDGWRLTHVAIVCVKYSPSRAVSVYASGQLDHVSIDDCTSGAQIVGGTVTVGPGFVARGNNSGIYVSNAKVTLVGGQGADHTSLSGNRRFGAWVRGNVGAEARLLIPGGDTTPATAAASDVDFDGNAEAGIYLELGPTLLDITGVHISENPTGLRANAGPATITVRHTFLANNARSAVSFGPSFWTATDAVSFGAAAGQAWGHNVFSVPNQAATANTEGALCVPPASPLRISAAGNVFGAIDCAAGGVLKRAAACASQVDVAVADATAIDLAGCTLAP